MGAWCAPGFRGGGPVSLTGPRSLGRRRLPPNLRVTRGPARLANGIPGGSPTRAPRSLGRSRLHLPPFGEAMPGSIGRPLCPSDPRAAPSLPSHCGAAQGLVGRLAPDAGVLPRGVRVGGVRRRNWRRGDWGAPGTCPGLRLGGVRCARVRVRW